MDCKVVFLHQAELDLIELKKYIINNFSTKSWQATFKKIKNSIHLLKKTPEAGSIPPELEKLQLNQYRQIIVGMNRIIYEIRKKTIFIHIVCDTRKDMQTLLAKRLLR
jgi:toxin ParE1/3/4